MRVIIAGASGLVGTELTKLCLDEPKITKVFVLVRNHMDMTHEKLEQIDVNYEDLHADTLPHNLDVIYNCLGTTIRNAGSNEAFKKVDYDYVIELAKLAYEKEVKKFISVSSIGAKKNSKLFYYMVKGQTEDFLMNYSKLENIFILRPSLLLGKRKEFRLGETIAKIFMTFINILFIGNLKTHKAIQATTVAKAMLNLSKMKETGKKIIENKGIFIIAKATE